jgi:hypothetical protein
MLTIGKSYRVRRQTGLTLLAGNCEKSFNKSIYQRKGRKSASPGITPNEI